MDIYLHRKGIISIWFSVDSNGNCPVYDFLNELDEKTRKRVLGLIDGAADYGPPKNQSRFKPLGSIYEFKHHSPAVRIFCFEVNGGYVLTHGVKKKPKDREYARHMEKTLRIMKEFEATLSS